MRGRKGTGRVLGEETGAAEGEGWRWAEDGKAPGLRVSAGLCESGSVLGSCPLVFLSLCLFLNRVSFG